MEREYFDARFDGLEKLMAAQEKNLSGYVTAVSMNVKEVRRDLQEHKESVDAHGAAASNRAGGSIILWFSLGISFLAAVAAAVPLIRK